VLKVRARQKEMNSNNNDDDDGNELEEVPLRSPKTSDIEVISDLASSATGIGSAGPVTFDNAAVNPNERSSQWILTRKPEVEQSTQPYSVTSNKSVESETMEERTKRHSIVMGQAKSEYKTHKKMLMDPNWTVVPYDGAKGISCYELPVRYLGEGKESPVYTIKASGTVSGKSADEIAKAHMDTNEISRLVWDKEISYIRELEKIAGDENTAISLTIQHAKHDPGIVGVAEREFVLLQWTHKVPSPKNARDHKWTLITRYTDHPDVPVQSSPVRALTMSVMLLEPLDPEKGGMLSDIPKTHVTLMGWAQPGGWIPESVVKLYKTKLADRIKFIRETAFC